MGIIFAALIYRESLPTIAQPLRASVLSLRMFSPSHARNSSSMSTMSDTDTLVDPDSPSDSKLTERLLGKASQGMDSPNGGSRKGGWGFWELMARGPVQVISITMFLNQWVSHLQRGLSLLMIEGSLAGRGRRCPCFSSSTSTSEFIIVVPCAF